MACSANRLMASGILEIVAGCRRLSGRAADDIMTGHPSGLDRALNDSESKP